MRNQIAVRRTFHPVKQFVSWHDLGQIDLRPPFQRKNVWKPRARSFLIDTILQGLPLPIIILRDKAGISLEPQHEVVDGQQRLTTLLAFIRPERFPLEAFTISRVHSKELADKRFSDLSDDLRGRILDYELGVHILPSSVDDQQVLRIFSRLNATGVNLNAQELRNAEFQGAFKHFAFELSLAHLDQWQSLRVFVDDDFARMKEVEYASDLIMRILYGTTASSKSVLNNLYRDFDEEFSEEDEVKYRFDAVLDEIAAGFGTRIGHTPLRRTTWFYTLFGVVHDRMFGTTRNADPPYLAHRRPDRLPGTFWPDVARFVNLLTSASIPAEIPKELMRQTTHLKSRRARESFFLEHVR